MVTLYPQLHIKGKQKHKKLRGSFQEKSITTMLDIAIKKGAHGGKIFSPTDLDKLGEREERVNELKGL